MLSNPNVINWATETLIRAGAAMRCTTHGVVHSTANDAAVRRAVILARINPFEDLSPNASELAVLETYLSMIEDCDQCTQREHLKQGHLKQHR